MESALPRFDVSSVGRDIVGFLGLLLCWSSPDSHHRPDLRAFVCARSPDVARLVGAVGDLVRASPRIEE